ncbi:MAG: hypothetical protein F8N36_13960 [Desulfovibrio sp.]|uniref:hypothetical protein n=1 Tax=Desulfovibrio sp. TaxID=885 RepID=UPI00135E72F7|nr:hypothetical protein [Desulfovibrio sp.]MTJ93944.1 hypothetical protein [Desulfovibrio sp.]
MALHLYKYDSDLPAECFAVDIGRETLYLTANRKSDGVIDVSINHGYEPGSRAYKRECQLFAMREKGIRQAAATAIAELEAAKAVQ